MLRDKTKSTLYDDTNQNGISFFQYEITKPPKGTEFEENIKRLFYNQNYNRLPIHISFLQTNLVGRT